LEFILNIIAGICLCAACGFRVFLPLLILSVYYFFGWIVLPESAEWIGSSPALIAFGAATVFEVAGYFSPWMDNMLDLITTPLALFAGLIIMSVFVTGVNPFLKWLIVILIGGGIGVNIQFLTVKARGLSAFIIEGGYGNPVFAIVEFVVAAVISFLAISVPIASLILLIVSVYVIRRIVNAADIKRKLLIT